MKKARRSLLIVAILSLVVSAILGMTVVASADTADAPATSTQVMGTKTYVPTVTNDVYDPNTVDQGIAGGGVDIRANSGVKVPLDAENVELEISMYVNAASGSRMHFGFSSAPVTTNKFAGPGVGSPGYDSVYFNMTRTNVSTDTVQITEATRSNAAGSNAGIGSFTTNTKQFMDHAIKTDASEVRLILKLTKGTDGYTLSFKSKNDNSVNKEFPAFTLSEGLSIANEKGQTYLFVGRYTNEAADAADKNAQYFKIYSVKKYDVVNPVVADLAQTTYAYTGKAITPEITVTDGSDTLVKGTDYTVAYADNTEAGTATVTVTYIGGYANCAAVTKEFTIKEAPTVSYPEQTVYTYTGSAIEPEITVTDGSVTLVKGTDYTVAYADNTDPGVATATVTFIGDYDKFDAVVRKYNIAKNDGLTVKKYVPNVSDFVNYWGGASDLSEENGGGVFTFAHASLTVPLKADEIAFTTNFRVPSNQPTEDGGDNNDAWLTVSFSATPGEAPDSSNSHDNSFPYYGGAKEGWYLQIANVSKTGVPNCAWVRVFKKTQAVANTGDQILEKFVDNMLVYKGTDVNIKFSVTLNQDGTYKIKMVSALDGTTVFMDENVDLDGVNFINEKGQTYFSTAIYEGGACDEQHWEHRGVAMFDAQVYTADASAAQVTLAQTSFVYEEGTKHKPDVTVTLGGTTLTNFTDYYVQYKNNEEVGTATAVITFIGDYAGNGSVQKEFTVTAASTGDNKEEPANKGCNSSVGGGFALVGILALAGALLLVSRRRIRTER